MLEQDEQTDLIAEFADSGVRSFQRQGSLVGVPGSYGLKRWLYKRWRNNGNAVYTFVCSLLAIALSGLWALIVKQPLLFPSLGATAFLIFETPMAEVGSPRNTMIGHTVGVAAGALSLRALRSVERAERVRHRYDRPTGSARSRWPLR